MTIKNDTNSIRNINNNNNNNNNNSSKNEALADALSGVIGTLVSLWCFYPIERIKTNIQAGKSLSTTTTNNNNNNNNSNNILKIKEKNIHVLLLNLLKKSFRGCFTKSLHATSSSFCYFYFYSWIVSFYKNKRQRRTTRIIGQNDDTTNSIQPPLPLRPSTRLVLSAIAAMINTFVTLPLDVLSLKRTVTSTNQDKERERGVVVSMEDERIVMKEEEEENMLTEDKNRNTASEKEKNENDEDENENNNNHAIMSKTWDSIGKVTTTTAYENQQQHSIASSMSPTTCSSSPSSSPSPSSSSTVELVFHDACSRSEEVFSVNENDNDNDDGNVKNKESNNNSNCNYEDEDDEDDKNLNTSSCSNNSSNSNDEYKMRWKQHQEQRQQQRRFRQQQKQHQIQKDSLYTTYSSNNNNDKNSSTSSNSHNSSTMMTIATSTSSITANNNNKKYSIVTFIRRWSKLWKGLTPALLLCTNPSIHYTVFDVLKTKLMAWKQLRSKGGDKRVRGIGIRVGGQYNNKSQSNNNIRSSQQTQQQQLSVSEVFILGLLSKFVATIVTYPLIRAKVLLMVVEEKKDDDDDDNNNGGGGGDSNSNIKNDNNSTSNNNSNNSSSSSSSLSLWSVLKESYHKDNDGIKGLYKGCDWQLIHTLLKSALMMTIREQITDKSRSLFTRKQ